MGKHSRRIERIHSPSYFQPLAFSSHIFVVPSSRRALSLPSSFLSKPVITSNFSLRRGLIPQLYLFRLYVRSCAPVPDQSRDNLNPNLNANSDPIIEKSNTDITSLPDISLQNASTTLELVSPSELSVESESNSANTSVIAEPQQKQRHFAAGFFVWAWTALKNAFAPGGFVWGLACGFAVSAIIYFSPSALGKSDALLREKVTIFDFILQDINSSYVDKVDINKMFETGVNSMLGSLDPYTQFENNSRALEMSVKTNGRYAGVGLGISLGDKTAANVRPIVVVSAFEGYAFDAGIRPGDVIESVAGMNVTGVSLEKVTDMLRGEPGTSVDVAVQREGFSEPLPFRLARRSVRIKDVPAATFVGDRKDGIGYIRLQSFAKDAASEVKNALEKLTSARKKDASSYSLQGLVLDLRDNPGGLLNAAIEVSEIFVPKGSVIVSTKGRGLGPSPLYQSSKEPFLSPEVPVTVLVNGQTASASEIVAGAIQDLDYGVIVGARTFGKGLVQNVQELPFNTALKYTVGKYYTPSGRCIQALNYEQSDGDGPFEARKVEEDQRKEFRTRRGRIVRDGGGIEPDMGVQRHPSFLELALQRQNMYFHFASRYGAESKLEKLPSTFAVTDIIYKDFVKFISSSEFKYESRFDEAFDSLDDMFKDVGYETARGKVGDLKRVTESEMKADFVKHEKDIRNQLESAIRYRFQPDSERIIAQLKGDEQLAEAIRVLKDRKEYSRLLSAEGNIELKKS